MSNSIKTVCAQCGGELTPVFESESETYQFRDALWLGFFGGYGMFVDEMTDWPGGTGRMLPGRPDFEAVLCGSCANRFIDLNPWAGTLLKRDSAESALDFGD